MNSIPERPDKAEVKRQRLVLLKWMAIGFVVLQAGMMLLFVAFVVWPEAVFCGLYYGVPAVMISAIVLSLLFHRRIQDFLLKREPFRTLHANAQRPRPGLQMAGGVYFIIFALFGMAIAVAQLRNYHPVDYERLLSEGTSVSGRIEHIQQPEQRTRDSVARIWYSYPDAAGQQVAVMTTRASEWTATLRPGRPVEVAVRGNESVIRDITPHEKDSPWMTLAVCTVVLIVGVFVFRQGWQQKRMLADRTET